MTNVASPEKVDRLFLELSSESRLDLLRELETKQLRMGELARRLHLTATEATRQLKRMTDALLIRRLPDGAYTATPYGRLVLQMSPSLEFVSRHREYFATRDLSRLPYPFVNRLGELSQGTLHMETMESIVTGEQLMGQVKRYFWALVPGPGSELLGPTVRVQKIRGVDFRFAVPAEHLPPKAPPPGAEPDFELRGLPQIPAILAATDVESFVSFPPIGGRWDYAGFYGGDPTFLQWTKDVFLHFWDQGKRVPNL